MKELVVCMPVGRQPHVASIKRAGVCGHEVYVSARGLLSYPTDAAFVCLDCADIAPDGSNTTVPEVAIQEALEFFRNRRKES